MKTQNSQEINPLSQDTTYNSDITNEDLIIIGQDFKHNLPDDNGIDLALMNGTREVDLVETI